MRDADKVYEIVNADKKIVTEIDVDGHTVKLGKNGMARVTDAGLAKEIDARYGQHARTHEAGRVVVVETDDAGGNPQRFVRSFRVPDLSRFKGYGED